MGCLRSVGNGAIHTDDLEVSLDKARSGEYHYILLSCSFVFNAQPNLVLSRIQNRGFRPALLIHCHVLEFLYPHTLSLYRSYSCLLYFVVSEMTPLMLKKIKDLRLDSDFEIHWILLPVKTIHIGNSLKLLSSNISHPRVSYYFPYKQDLRDHFYETHEIESVIKKIKKWNHFESVGPLVGLDLFDPRIPTRLEMEPLGAVTMESQTLENDFEKNIKISVIIPTYNNARYLQNTLKHLMDQNLDRRQFEIIVVDDGSDDDTQQRIQQFTRDWNFKCIFFSRSSPRKMGDNQYRAGIARNLGVKYARGNLLAFLDSDILTPKNFLSDLIEKHQSWDVIQAKRIYLHQSVSSETTHYEDIVLGRDNFIAEDYWHNFFNNTTDWNQLEAFWKYTCTYALSVPAQLFKDVGWFRKIYVYYGFEDTDLGYRLAQRGARFLLNNVDVYHLEEHRNRSEYNHSPQQRFLLLSKTAKIFYHHTLDPLVYKHLGNYLRCPGSMAEFFGLLASYIPFLGWLMIIWWKLVEWSEPIWIHLWRLNIPLNILWRFQSRIHVFWNRWALSHSWRIHVFWNRWVRSHAWRPMVFFQRLLSHSWKLKVVRLQSIHRLSKFSLRIRAFIWKVLFPIRKLYYFSSYQYNKRVLGLIKANEK